MFSFPMLAKFSSPLNARMIYNPILYITCPNDHDIAPHSILSIFNVAAAADINFIFLQGTLQPCRTDRNQVGQ